jgi:asparagine synthase (glutamine-hydrolysing)
MSGIYGIFNRNHQPVDKAIVHAMRDAISYWNPDELGEWTEGPVALGHAMLWNTPESHYEHLPLQTESYVLTMDARIDNREELAKELDLPNRPIEEIGDSEFILAAYTKWGEECPKYLLGDFAFAIWDEKKQQLFCARDPFGIKLFHYYRDKNLFIFSNDIQGILSHPNVPKLYDEKCIALFLQDQGGVYTLRDTFFENIKKLPGAMTLIVTSDEVREQTFWQIEKSPKIRYDSFQEYIDTLRTLLDSAVEVRLRTAYPVVSHLSGGIDSSPIAVLAARKLKERKQQLHAYNWIDIPKESEAYETEAYEFSRRIANLEQINHHEFTIDPAYRAKWWDTHDITNQGNMFYLGEYYIQNEAEQIGARTILSGWGGDELISYNGYTYMSGLFK